MVKNGWRGNAGPLTEGLKVGLLHGFLVLRFEVAIECNVLIHRQSLTPGVSGNQLQLGIGHPGVPGQPSDALMPERVRRCRHASLLCIQLHNLLNPSGRVPGVPPGLKEPAIVRVGSDVRPQCRAEALAKQHEAVLIALAAVDPDLVVLQVDVLDLDAAQL